MQDHVQINKLYIHTPLPVFRVFGARSGSPRITKLRHWTDGNIMLKLPELLTVKVALQYVRTWANLISESLGGVAEDAIRVFVVRWAYPESQGSCMYK